MPIVTNLRKYLGMPLLTTRRANSLFTPLVDRINNQIRNWQAKLISQAGRITLIKSILSPLAYFLMQTTLLLVRHLISNRKNQSMASFGEILLRYFWTSNFLTTTSKNGSHSWKALLKGRELLTKGLKWVIIGNSIWHMPHLFATMPLLGFHGFCLISWSFLQIKL